MIDYPQYPLPRGRETDHVAICPKCNTHIAAGHENCPACSVRISAAAANALAAGELLAGRYRLVCHLGRGGLGDVWLAEDSLLDNDRVACKILRDEYFRDKRALADLKREVLLARRLRHPGILGVHTFCESDGHRFIVMEYVEGANLAESLYARETPFTPHDIAPWIAQLADALDYAHVQGVLHRDIKPANLLLGRDGRVRLADFGIARTIQEMTAQTADELTCGTLLFMSPEQLRGERLDTRADLYSLAASAYELLAGTPPFHTGPLVDQIQRRDAPPIPHISNELNRVLARALAKSPDHRYPSCGAFSRAFSQAAVTSPGDALGLPIRPWCAVDRNLANAETRELAARDTSLAQGRLGAILLEEGVVSRSQLDAALARQQTTQERLGEALIALGFSSEEVIGRALGRQLQLPFSLLDQEPVAPQTTQILSTEIIEQRCCLPLRHDSGTLRVAMADPLDIETINELEASSKSSVEILVTTASAIRRTLLRTKQA